MPVGAESLKRTAKSVAAPKKQTAAKTKTAKAEAPKTVKSVKPENDSAYTSGIKCELPIHLL